MPASIHQNNNNGGGNPEPVADQQTDNDTIVFPEAAWSGHFKGWRDMVAPCTESAFENLWAAFIVSTGLMLGRNVWMESPRPLYPNFYIMLLGQTGDARKSTVLWLAEQLLKYLDVKVEILTGIVSTEGLFERLSMASGTKGLGYVDELRVLLSVGKRHGTKDLIPKLQSLYACPDKETIDRRLNPTTIVKPFFSMVSATVLEYVQDILGNLEVEGGFLNRNLIVSGKEQAPKPHVTQPSVTDWNEIASPVRMIGDRYKSNPKKLEWSPEAKELWTQFYTQWRTDRTSQETKANQLTARIFEHVMKISMVYAVLANEDKISGQSLTTAIEIGKWFEATALRLFGDVGLDPYTKAERAVLGIVKSSRQMYRRELQQIVEKKKINGELFNRVLSALEKNGHIELGEERTVANRIRVTVTYLGNR